MARLFGGGGSSTPTTSASAPARSNMPGSVDTARTTALFNQRATQRRGIASSILASGLSLLGRLKLGQ